MCLRPVQGVFYLYTVMDKPKGSLISFMANKVKSEGGINLAQGIPSFDPPKELLKILSEVAFDKVHQYAPGNGNAQLLELLSLHYNKAAKQFLIVNGATEAISTILTYIVKEYPGAGIMAFNPVYESYKHLPRLFNVPFVGITENELDFNALAKQVNENNIKLILLASPGNPFGKVYTKTQMNKLVEFVEENNIYLIIDAVYSDLYFEDAPYYPIESLSDQVFYVNAFSKKLSITGWRLGYLMCSEKHMSALMDVHDYIGLSSPSVLQHALVSYLKENNFGSAYTQELRDNLKLNYKQMATALTQMGFKVIDAQGGYFVWCKLPDGFSSGFEFAIQLYNQQKVAVVPGIHFDENGQKMIRINIARLPYEISMAVEKIKKFIANNVG